LLFGESKYFKKRFLRYYVGASSRRAHSSPDLLAGLENLRVVSLVENGYRVVWKAAYQVRLTQAGKRQPIDLKVLNYACRVAGSGNVTKSLSPRPRYWKIGG
jgi:hypothetical protein